MKKNFVTKLSSIVIIQTVLCGIMGHAVLAKNIIIENEQIQQTSYVENVNKKSSTMMSRILNTTYTMLGEDLTTQDGFQYEVNDDGATVSIIGYTGNQTNLVIPEKIGKYSVSSIRIFMPFYKEPDKSTIEKIYKITSVSIPASVTDIGSDAFTFLYSLTNIKVNTNNKNYCDVDGVLYNKNKTEIIKYPVAKNETKYNIANTVNKIGNSAFALCKNLTNITIPANVTTIGGHAFEQCKSLANITIPSKVTTIEYGAFSECENLTSINIPASVLEISIDALDYCKNLTSIKVDANNKNYCDVNGVLYNKEKTKIVKYPAGKKETKYSIAETAIIIGDSAFSECNNLTNITIPSKVTEIGYGAFRNCTSLTSISIPASVTTIEIDAFDEAKNLTIYCPKNSVAETYAKEHKIKYSNTTMPDNIRGDLSGDGKTSVTDLILMKKKIVGLTETTNNDLQVGDLNNDKKLSATDLLILKKIIVGLI